MSQAAYLSSPLSGEGGVPEGGLLGGGGEIFQWKTNGSSLNVLACLSKWVYWG